MMRLQTNWPIASTMKLGEDLIDQANVSDVAGVLAKITTHKSEYTEHAAALAHMSLLYERFLTFNELNHLEGLRRVVKMIVVEADTPDTDDGHKASIMTSMESINVLAIALGMSFVDHGVLNQQTNFNAKLGALRRRWDVPNIRKRLRGAR